MLQVKPIRVNGKITGENIATGDRVKHKEEGGSSGLRYTQLNTAEKNGQILQQDEKTGKWRRLKPEATKDIVDNAGKLDFTDYIDHRDPKQMFDQLELLTQMVVTGIQPSLLVTGGAGLGKTHIVKETILNMGRVESRDFVHFKGRATAPGLYITLYENADSIIILDDCDSVFKDDDAVNMLKAALDSEGDTRKISYLSAKLLKDENDQYIPRHFEFTGRVIFITNIAQRKLDAALKSRSFVADITMTKEQVFERMEQVMPKIEPRIPLEKKQEALALMKKLDKEYANVEINLRSFIKAARICSMGFDNSHDMVAEQIIPA